MISPQNWPRVVRYAVTPIAVALALGCRLSLNPFLHDASPFMYFFVAIIVSAWLGGLGPGLVATALSMLAVLYFYQPPIGSVLPIDAKEIIQAISFLFLGSVVSLIVARMKREQRRAEHAANEARINEAEARRTTEALRQSEERLRATFDNAALGIVETDAQERFVAVNERICQILGYRGEDLLGKSVHELTAPEDCPRSDEMNAQLHDGRRKRIDYEKRYLRQDGSPLWVHVTVAAVHDSRGRYLHAINTIEDISKRKAAEAQLRLQARALDAAANGIVVTDPTGTILWANPASASMTGYDAHEIIGRNPRILKSGKHDEAFYRAMWETIRRGEVWHGELVNRRKDGTLYTEEMSIAPMVDEYGAISHYIAIKQDVTERKAAEEALREADLRKDEFMAMLAHELRNPLAPIRYATQMLHMNGLTQDQLQKQREVIDRQVSHMGRLLDDLLDVSRITCGKIQLRREIVDLRAVAAQALDSLRPMIEGRGQHLLYEGPSSPLPVDGDPTRLEQIIRNLLHNANKYTEADGCIKLSLLLETDHENEWRAVVRVSDSGIGIPLEVLPRVFEAFVQAEQSLARTQGGLGIGLAMVKSLVQMHGGNVEAHSEGPGRGSEFVVRLPLAVEVLGGFTKASVPETQYEATRTNPRRVLVVDDNEDAAASLSELLGLWGYEVQTAHDGRHALAAARDWQPEIVLLDIGLPGMDGYEVARHLRENPVTASAFLVALTGYGQDEDRRRAQEAGFNQHLTKPVGMDQLQMLLHEAHAS